MIAAQALRWRRLRSVAGPSASAGWAAAGIDADEIQARIHQLIARCRLYFLVATLDYLARGGRIGGAQALLGMGPLAVSSAPRYLQELSYPTYFEDLVQAEAGNRGLDPAPTLS